MLTAIANVLCAIMLWMTIARNVTENRWELSVLRSIGYTRFQLIRVYLYESIALVLSCILLGTLVGLFISLALSMQNQIITEAPVHIFFPVQSYVIIVTLSLCTAIITPVIIINHVSKAPIAKVLRSTC